MDEQTIQQEQTITESNDDTEFPVVEDSPVQADEQEPEISVTDGEVNFSDDFFGDVPDEPLDDSTPQKQSDEPNYYTNEELQNTPFEQWDKARMPVDVKPYVEAYLKQREAQKRQQEAQLRAQTPPSFLTPPKQYTPKELYDESMKLAVQKLGLKSPDEYDEYEGIHRTALDMARQEIMQKNAAEAADYQRKFAEHQQWESFRTQLAGQTDFEEFHQWYLDEVKKNGNTPEQIDQGLQRVAREQGLGAVSQIWGEFYRQFRASRVQRKNTQQVKPKTPPLLESTRGGNYDGGRNVDLRKFGQLDEDAQVQALMDMGIV